MNAQDAAAARERHTQLRRETGEHIEHAGLVQDAASPGDSRCHGCIALHQIDTCGRFCGGCVRRGLLAGQDVAVGVPADHVNARQFFQQLKYFSGPWAEQDEVAQCPPAVHVIAGCVR
jgi:hypothetical protein